MKIKVKKNFLKIDNEKFGAYKKKSYICHINFGTSMTDEKEIIVKEFRDKFARLVAICDRLKSECVKLEASNKELEDKMKTRESDYQQLKLRYENMKTVVSLLDGKDKHDAKIYLNRIVRDIDKCLSMLLD